MNAVEKFIIKDKVVIITGGAGLLGRKHAEAVIEGEGIAVLIDVCESAIQNAKTELLNKYGKAVSATFCRTWHYCYLVQIPRLLPLW